jgi:hypothetical protein
MRPIFRAVVHEPLVYFLALGALIFAANALLHPSNGADPRRIEITRADIARIGAIYAQQWGAAPRVEDMPSLIDNYLRSEILFREGTALGLAADDSVLRNRVVQKMEFLLQDASAVSQPTDAEIAAWFQAHQAAYRVPEQVGFIQLYFSPSLRGDRAEADARAALVALGGGQPPAGDRFMLGDDPSPRSEDAIGTDFGPDFAKALFAAPEGVWTGPLRSAFGFHLVRVLEHRPAQLPALAEVRDRVHDDLMADRLRAATEAAYARVRAKYKIVVDPVANPAGTPLAAGSP